MTRRSRVACIGILVGLLAAAPAMAGITIEELPLADGRRALVHEEKLYLPDSTGLLEIAPDGRYALKGGGDVAVRAGGRVRRPGLEKRFDPQPEPPGIALHGTLLGGQEVLLVRQQLFLLQGGKRLLCPDGAYRLKGGASLQILGGRVTSLSSLEGLSVAGGAGAQR